MLNNLYKLKLSWKEIIVCNVLTQISDAKHCSRNCQKLKFVQEGESVRELSAEVKTLEVKTLEVKTFVLPICCCKGMHWCSGVLVLFGLGAAC